MNLPQISKIMMEFEKQNEMMGAPVPTPTSGRSSGQLGLPRGHCEGLRGSVRNQSGRVPDLHDDACVRQHASLHAHSPCITNLRGHPAQA